MAGGASGGRRGGGVAEYIRNMRVQQAKNILLNSPASIKELAAYAGFRQASHFSSAPLKRWHFRAHWTRLQQFTLCASRCSRPP